MNYIKHNFMPLKSWIVSTQDVIYGRYRITSWLTLDIIVKHFSILIYIKNLWLKKNQSWNIISPIFLWIDVLKIYVYPSMAIWNIINFVILSIASIYFFRIIPWWNVWSNHVWVICNISNKRDRHFPWLSCNSAKRHFQLPSWMNVETS